MGQTERVLQNTISKINLLIPERFFPLQVHVLAVELCSLTVLHYLQNLTLKKKKRPWCILPTGGAFVINFCHTNAKKKQTNKRNRIHLLVPSSSGPQLKARVFEASHDCERIDETVKEGRTSSSDCWRTGGKDPTWRSLSHELVKTARHPRVA